MKRTTKMKGFTLVELVIVIAILAILTAIGLQIFNGVQENARLTTAESNARQLAGSITTYITMYRSGVGSSDPSTWTGPANFYAMYTSTPGTSGKGATYVPSGETFGVMPPFFSVAVDETNAIANVTLTKPAGYAYPLATPLNRADIKSAKTF